MERFHKILVPLDTSALATRALDLALRLAREYQAKLILLGVRSEAAPLDHGPAERAIDTIEGDTEALLRFAQGRIPAGWDLPPDTLQAEIRSGFVVGAIVEAAEEHMVDLIVMGTHGRQGISEIFTGSTTEQVMAKSTASVLAVKPVGYPYLRD